MKIEGKYSTSFKVGKGVGQGCILSPILFNIYQKWTIRSALENLGGGVSVGAKTVTNLMCSNDMIVLAQNEYEIFELPRKWKPQLCIRLRVK